VRCSTSGTNCGLAFLKNAKPPVFDADDQAPASERVPTNTTVLAFWLMLIAARHGRGPNFDT
jgi:hypothetical protein